MSRTRSVRQHRLTRRLFSAIYRLPKPGIRTLGADLDVEIPMADGVVLLADRWAPADLPDDAPTVLVRTCYDRKTFWSLAGRAYAERGFQTVIVNSRGTFGSGGGPFYPMDSEHDDGIAVLDWVRAQPWYRGSMILAGASYLGYTQWSVAADAPDDVVAMHPHLTSARLAQNFSTTGALELDTAARWSYIVARQEIPRAGAITALGIDRRKLEVGLNTLPVNIIDAKTIGTSYPFFQDTITRLEDDPRWHPWNHSVDVPRVRVPASFVAGWYDAFLVDELSDYRVLREAGTPTRLTIGPWTHLSFGASSETVRDTIDWGGMHAGKAELKSRAPVRVYVMGAKKWEEFEHWPPLEAEATPWYLAKGGALGTEPPTGGAFGSAAQPPSEYHFDPAAPTPSVGGRLLLAGAGRKDNRSLEARDDVLTFTSERLSRDLRLVGEISAEVWMTSTRPTWDLFVRLCDVDRRGRSFNVSDGLIRTIMPTGIAPDEPYLVRLRLAPTAQEFARGHRIRIQVSSGAHPRFARNLGTVEEQAGSVDMFDADQKIFHDAERPSAVWLPVLP